MFERAYQPKVTATARPLRVAYLVDAQDCPNECIDAIFEEAYSRWGGRRTLIVPATTAGPDPRYAEWLHRFDADVIYSFVDLLESLVTSLHEKLAPAYLVKHYSAPPLDGQTRDYRVRLPVHALESVSVLTWASKGVRRFGRSPQVAQVLNKYWDRSESTFLAKNFGFLLNRFQLATMNSPDIFTCLELITQESLDDPRMGKSQNAEYITTESEIVRMICDDPNITGVANLSDVLSPHFDYGWQAKHQGFDLVVGDSFSDQVFFWNIHHQKGPSRLGGISGLLVSAHDTGSERLRAIAKLVKERYGNWEHGQIQVHLHSCSVDAATLEKLKKALIGIEQSLAVRVFRHNDHGAGVPSLGEEGIGWRTGSFMEPRLTSATESAEGRFQVPQVIPQHLKDWLPPPPYRQGLWMTELVIERHVDHSRYSNLPHIWLLPRRGRIDDAIVVEFERKHEWQGYASCMRPLLGGLLGFAISYALGNVKLTMPDDQTAIRQVTCGHRRRHPFKNNSSTRAFESLRFSYAEPSDKGRYLLGALGLFESLPDAFGSLLDEFWRQELALLGATSPQKNVELQERLLKKLRLLRGQHGKAALTFDTKEQQQRLAFEALKAAHSLPRDILYFTYDKVRERWKEFLKAQENQSSAAVGTVEEGISSGVKELDAAIQHLCDRQVLYQGHAWRCGQCYNRNWVGIDDLRTRLSCGICQTQQPAPVSGSWHFRANAFLVDAFKDNGVEAVIWMLSVLAERARASFYFSPALNYWNDYPNREDDGPDVEVDALVVVDGLLFMCEAKMSSGLDTGEIAKLALAAERIRPDFVLLAFADALTGKAAAAKKALSLVVPAGVQVETINRL